MKIEEELIIKLTLHSLDNFIKYKELNLSNKIANKISFSSILSTICIKACIKHVIRFYNPSHSSCVKIKKMEINNNIEYKLLAYNIIRMEEDEEEEKSFWMHCGRMVEALTSFFKKKC